jgi:hypothetical protein
VVRDAVNSCFEGLESLRDRQNHEDTLESLEEILGLPVLSH